MKKIKRMTCGLLPLLAGAAVLIEHYTVPNAQAVSGTLPVFIGILMCGVLILTLLSIQSSSVLNWLRDRSAWYTAIFLIFLVLDVLTQKTGIFGPPMFPSPDRLLAELVLDRSILLDCAGNSLKLLFTGYFWGMLIGLLTGIPAGRSRKARYWIAPILRVLAPIPSVTWMALFFVLSKSLFQGCVAMVAYSVWYPVASGIMRGILQVDHAYIEAAQTLGASSEWKNLRYVTLPSVLPCLFQGMISGMCAACGSLMIAEMMGVESGLAWYITWQRGWGNFTKMYTAIVMICITFLFVDAALGLLRRRILRWEENADA